MESSAAPALRLAAQCRFLRMTLDAARRGEVLNLCLHIVRDGSECVGPFLDDHETSCGLFEQKEGLRFIAVRD
jgi:hypothetical protein